MCEEKAIFFLRHNNDIDHIVPVIYKWLTTENIQTDIIITTQEKLLKDSRLKYLEQFEQLRIFHINDFFKKYTFPFLFNYFYFRFNTIFDTLFKKHKSIKKISDNIIKQIAEKIFENMDKGIVVFDWIITEFVKGILKEAKKRRLTTISLPHGDEPYYNLIQLKEDINYNRFIRNKKTEPFDYVVVPNYLCAKRYEEGVKILGSPRYCDEWMKIIPKFTKKAEIEGSENKLKIVFYLRHTNYPIFWEEVKRTIKLIMQFSNVYLVVKHHPRCRHSERITRKIKDRKYKNLKFVYDDTKIGSLIDWCDMAIDTGTSMAWEFIKKKKPIFMMEYLHANKTTIAHYFKDSEIKCRDELYDYLKKKRRIYNKGEREKFIREIIDVPDKKVLERYCKFLRECLYEK